MICSVVIVDDTVDDCVWTSSVPPLTSTVSVRLPTSSVPVMLPGVAASRRTSLMTTVLKPLSETVTVYVPGSSTGIENAPVELLRVSKVLAGGVVLDRDGGAGNDAAGAIDDHSRQRRCGAALCEGEWLCGKCKYARRQQPEQAAVHEVSSLNS